jgi:Leucine-rich repeat (LRR) protein
MNGNRLSTLPMPLAKLPLSKYLYMADNQFKSIPEVVLKLNHKYLNFSGNQIKYLPQIWEVLKSGSTPIKLNLLHILSIAKKHDQIPSF